MEPYNYQNFTYTSNNYPPQTLPQPIAPPTFDRALTDPRLSSSSTFTVLPCPELIPQPPAYNENANTQFINTWLMEKGKFHQPNLIKEEKIIKKRNKYISIRTAKQALKYCLEIINKMNETQEELRMHVETMSTNDWKQKSIEIGCLRDEFDKLMTKFEDVESIKLLQNSIKKRIKKRINQKKRKILEKELNAKREEARLLKHKKIDNWLESMKQETENIKMEEKLKKDTDCILYEVSRKKTDARKNLSLISALVKLRNVRDNMATQRGEKTSLEDRKAFGLVTEKLIRTWENCCQNYSKEEQQLRATLEHNQTADSEAIQLTKDSNIIDEWDNVLFGDKPNEMQKNNPTFWALTSADRDMETFIAIRKSWDTFVTNASGVGSAIPVGWVLPPSNANSNWLKYLDK